MRIQVIAAVLASVGSASLAADQPLYVGSWDCEVSTFTFTKDSYDSGEGPLPIKKVEQDGANFILTLDGDYQIGLSSVTETSLQWLSMASGDMFDCKRLE